MSIPSEVPLFKVEKNPTAEAAFRKQEREAQGKIVKAKWTKISSIAPFTISLVHQRILFTGVSGENSHGIGRGKGTLAKLLHCEWKAQEKNCMGGVRQPDLRRLLHNGWIRHLQKNGCLSARHAQT